MELATTYNSYGYTITVTSVKNGKGTAEEISAIEYTIIGVDKQQCINHSVQSDELRGRTVLNIEVKSFRCIVAIPAMMELKSIEVCDLD